MTPTITGTPTVTGLAPRQLWGFPSATDEGNARCTPFSLPSGSVLSLDKNTTVTLSIDATFSPMCTSFVSPAGLDYVGNFTDFGSDAPFYASTTPLIYVVAATTVLAWVLLITTLIIPGRVVRSNTADSRFGFFGGRGIISGVAARQSSPHGSSSRPWLQKVAALAVSISLTIATADTFKVAESQYGSGFLSAALMRVQVTGSLEIRIMRVVSDIFLWLAQVQTLIRLFPRHKEKLVIKWIGFLLIVLDVVFSCLNSFLVHSFNRPRSYQDAIPALSYLFQLALSLLYMSWVFYYAISKRRFAFYNPKMPNICIVALLSTIALLVPVVFFVADVAQPDVAGWGDYFRWVGAAGGSIIVWEWVDRIEALEGEERNEGILGREIFDGDEMIGSAANKALYRSNTRSFPAVLEDPDDQPTGSKAFVGGALTGLASRLKQSRPAKRLIDSTKALGGKQQPRLRSEKTLDSSDDYSGGDDPNAEPVDRAHTTSAATESTVVYTVRYHPVISGTRLPGTISEQSPTTDSSPAKRTPMIPYTSRPHRGTTRPPSAWLQAANPFKRKRTTPPLEIRNAVSAAATQPALSAVNPRQPEAGTNGQLGAINPPHTQRSQQSRQEPHPPQDRAQQHDPQPQNANERPTSSIFMQSGGGILGRLAVPAKLSARRRSRISFPSEERSPTVIPAPPRGRTWSPDAFNDAGTGTARGPAALDVMTGTVPSPDIHYGRRGGGQSAADAAAAAAAVALTQNPATQTSVLGAATGAPFHGTSADRPFVIRPGDLGYQVENSESESEEDDLHQIADEHVPSRRDSAIVSTTSLHSEHEATRRSSVSAESGRGNGR